ncbi:MAG: DUF5717 family protein [Lachnospiraceae bacterium]|nr:DUF5717 family protein [Lachnospiraceae bacterium]
MRRRIEQLLNGIFEYEQGRLVARPDELELKASVGSVLRGKLFLEGTDGQRVHGFLYPSDARMICDPVEFHGISNEIHYQFDCSGLKAGAVSSGRIVVCSDCGEDEIPYTVSVASGMEEEKLPFSTPAEFTRLAEADYQRAYRYFLSPGFRVLLKGEPELLALYEGLGVPDAGCSGMEEFLVGAGQKDALLFSFVKENPEGGKPRRTDTENAGEPTAVELDYGELNEPVQETVRLRKSTWGFQTISVESDALFVRPERWQFTTDDFVGSTFDLNLILDTNLMHAGNNYARLTLTAGRQTLLISLTAKKKALWGRDHQAHIRKIMIKKLENLYVSFRLQKTDLPTWIEHSISVINSYKRAGGDDPFADLFLVQMYFADDKKHKASRLLEQIEAQKERLDTPERYCFYLYITTFFYQEISYVDRVEEEVCREFYRNPASWPLQWILLYLQEKFLNAPDSRYEAVAEQFRSGCRSRILYVEAWQALKANPFLLRHLGEYELHLLRFADEEKVMTAEILRQVANLAMHQSVFDQRLYDTLTHGWRLYPSDDLVKAICQILIRGEKKDSLYFEWYARGVENGFRMNGLYEAYMQTMETVVFRDLPQIIRMYFVYDTSLDYRRRAALYRSILDNRESDPQTWHNHRSAMERFVMEQLESGHISDDLAVLYRGFLREAMITVPLAHRLIRLLFTYEITCDCPGIRQIAVRSVRMPGEETVNLVNGRCQIRLYDPDGAVFAVDAKGQRYEASVFCRMERVFEDEKLLAWCAKKAPDHPGLVVFLCVESLKANLMNDKLLPYFCTGCELGEISADFRDELRRVVLAWYMAHPREDSLPEFLERISCEEYALADKAALITLLAEEGRCTEAFALLNTYGAEDIPLLQLVRICSRMVLELEFEENAMLLSLCHWCFANGKYDDKLLRYLILYYEGSVEDMKQVWTAACEFELDTMLLEEKILMLMLFTRRGTEGSEMIFEAYWKKMGRKKLCRAYVNLKSWEYFVKGLPVADSVFLFIENEYRRLSGLNRISEQEEVCRLALLQHYARAVSLTKTQRVFAEEMLEEFNTKGMRFAFFKRFDRELLKPWQMQGHVFAEYVGNPGSTVYIFYRYRGQTKSDVPDAQKTPVAGVPVQGGREQGCPEEPAAEAGYVREVVPNCFEGIFVREFTLFAGEEIECSFVEDNGQDKICSGKWTLRAEQEDEAAGMYGLLNRFCRALQDKNEAEAEEALDSWLTFEYLADEVFTLV